MELNVDEMKEIVEREVLEYMVKFEDRFNGQTIFPINIPDIQFKVKGLVAGYASLNFHTGSCTLDFNEAIMEDNFDDFVDRTVPHEVAHYCSMLLKGQIKRGSKTEYHGAHWRSIMRFFGVDDIKRCHSYRVDKANRKMRRRFSYKCDCGYDHQLATVTHNRIQREQKSFICKDCRSTLTWTGKSKCI